MEDIVHDTKSAYTPGVKRWSLYRDLWMRYGRSFVSSHNALFAAKYGSLDEDARDEIHKVIECGEFANGFVMHTCEKCGTKIAVPFTCKSRLCLSCRHKSLFGWSINLSELIDTSMRHVHVTFTLPGRVKGMVQGYGFDETELITLAAGVYMKLLRMSMCYDRNHMTAGILASLHKCGNSLNYNPHVHLVGSVDMVHRKTGEIIKTGFIHYTKARHLWMKAVTGYLLKKGLITSELREVIHAAYKDGFHVYFRHIKGDSNEILSRTAEYIASGYFHNSQITEVNHRNKTVTFEYKKHVDRKSGERQYATMTLGIHEFLARMIYYLPDKYRKYVRWYGLYANGIREKMKRIERKSWKTAVERSFGTDPGICPRCESRMTRSVVFSYSALRVAKDLWRTHACVNGYFIPYRNDS